MLETLENMWIAVNALATSWFVWILALAILGMAIVAKYTDQHHR